MAKRTGQKDVKVAVEDTKVDVAVEDTKVDVAVEDTKVDADENKASAEQSGAVDKTPEELEEEAKDAEALALALRLKEEKLAKEEGPATSHPDMCDISMFGKFDLSSDYCKACAKEFTECANQCKALSDFNKSKSGASAKTPGTRTPRAPRPEGSVAATGIPAITGTGSTAQIYGLMCRAEGATFAEMQACRRDTGKPQAVKDAALRKLIGEFKNKNGANVVVEGDRYFIKALEASVEEKSAE